MVRTLNERPGTVQNTTLDSIALHGDLNWGIYIDIYDKGKTSFDMSFKSGQICIGFEAANFEKVKKKKTPNLK